MIASITVPSTMQIAINPPPSGAWSAACRVAVGMHAASLEAMKRVVMGIVDTPAQADVTVRQLVAAGFPTREISVLYPDRHGDHDFAFEAKTKAPEGALIGIGLGGILGATVGIALGLAGRSLRSRSFLRRGRSSLLSPALP